VARRRLDLRGWGLWHGAGLIVCRYWQRLGRPLPALIGWAVTFLFVVAGWVLFRAADFSTAAGMLRSMAGLDGFGGAFRGAGLIALGALLSALVPSAHELAGPLA
jgi:alginate O-acetyltransferase complex protein AlgI